MGTIKATARTSGNVIALSHNLGITDPKKPGNSKIKGCLGFEIVRINLTTGEETVLSGKVPFKGTTNPDWKDLPSTICPVQKPQWKDFDPPRGATLAYRFTPMMGTPDKLVPAKELAVTTNAVVATGKLDEQVHVEFNNAFLSTQWMKRSSPKLPNGDVDFPTLLSWLGDPKNPMAIRQGGYLLDLLMSAIQQARAEGGKAYLVLYELAHPALLDLILLNKDVVHIILSNTGPDDETNKAGRARLHAAGVDITDRFVAPDEIGHNKYVIYADRTGKMLYIVSGTTNWTVTGVTCQNNVGIKLTDDLLAMLYGGEFGLLQADSKLNPVQGMTLRKRNSVQPPIIVLKNGARVQAFFAPNTKAKAKPKTPHPLPVDRAYGEMVLRGAEEMAVGAFFLPGSPSYLDAFRWLKANKQLAVLKVAVSSIMALIKGDTLLARTNGERPVAVVANELRIPHGDELPDFDKLPDAHAIIHLKVFCVDARHKNRWKICVHIASHNGGDKASYQNDENTLFIWGHRGLAEAVMVALFDIWDHYWFRTQVDFNMKGDVFQGYLATDDSWMDKYTVPNAQTLQELVYLTQDVVEEDGPVPDFLQEEADVQAAVQQWIAGTYVNSRQVQPISQTDWVLTDQEAAGTATPQPSAPDANAGQKPVEQPTGRKPHDVTAGDIGSENAGSTPAQPIKPMHPVKRVILGWIESIRTRFGRGR